MSIYTHTDVYLYACRAWHSFQLTSLYLFAKSACNYWRILAHLQSLIVAVRGISAEVDYADRPTAEAEYHSHRIVIAYRGYLWGVCVYMGGHTMRVFPQHPTHDIDVVNCAVVEDATYIKIHGHAVISIAGYVAAVNRLQKCEILAALSIYLSVYLSTSWLSGGCQSIIEWLFVGCPDTGHFILYWSNGNRFRSVPDVLRYAMVGSGESLLHTLIVWTCPTSPCLTRCFSSEYAGSNLLKKKIRAQLKLSVVTWWRSNSQPKLSELRMLLRGRLKIIFRDLC